MPAFSEMIETYVDGSSVLRRIVAGMAADQLTARPLAGKWSTLEVVCHLVDSDQAWIHRMKRIIAEDRPLLIGYDESNFAKALAYHDRDLNEELELFEKSRQQMARILRRIPPESWRREGVHSERGRMSLEESLQIEIDHLLHHVKFIAEKRTALGIE